MSKYDLKTGDILLFDGNSKNWFFKTFDFVIKYFTNSKYTHIGLVLKDPTYINPDLKGYYVWESGSETTPDPQDNKKKFGVQITPLEHIVDSYLNNGGYVYYRKINSNKNFNTEKLLDIHKVVYDKPYDFDIIDWIDAGLKKDGKKVQKTDKFWCSAFVGYIYDKCNIIKESTNWTILTPNDFSETGENLDFINNFYLEQEEDYIK